jgi:hypothetical protein
MPPADHQPVDPERRGGDSSEAAGPGEPEAAGRGDQPADGTAEIEVGGPVPVSQQELNAWRRGFTPQAEIWNGRLAMLGLSVGLTVLLIARLVSLRQP